MNGAMISDDASIIFFDTGSRTVIDCLLLVPLFLNKILETEKHNAIGNSAQNHIFW